MEGGRRITNSWWLLSEAHAELPIKKIYNPDSNTIDERERKYKRTKMYSLDVRLHTSIEY
jgi:hypothetical protein